MKKFGWLILFLAFGVSAAEDKNIHGSLATLSHAGYAFSVLVSQNGKTVIKEAYGWADEAKKCKTTVHTLFNLASISKAFTAIVIFQLEKAGKIHLNDSLDRFFADVPKDKQAITVQQLLVHTSGLGQNYAADNKKTRADAVHAIFADPLGSAPGAEFNYSNENYELLAAIVEVSSGETYESFVRKNIFDRAGMIETKFWDEVDPRTDCKVASLKKTDVPVAVRDWGYIGSGGLYSNVVDLERWFSALTSGKLLDPGSVEEMWKPLWKASTTQIASGWFVSEGDYGKEIWTRGTEDWGHNGVLRWFPEKSLLVIVQTNSGELGDKNMTGNRLISDTILPILMK